MEDEGLSIVLTPLQLAAVIASDSIEESSCLGARFTGAAIVVAGAVELVGAAALLLLPEPTTLSKIGGGALALHGADVTSAGLVQIASCQTRTTLTAQGVSAAAASLGVDPNTARHIGFAIDVAVPVLAGFTGFARASAITRGSINLAAEEAAGGHTIARHVGRTEAQLRSRLATQPGIKAASSFRSLRDAERVVAETIRANQNGIREWARDATPNTTKAFRFTSGDHVGHGVARATGQFVNMSKVVVVLKKVAVQNRVYFVLTAFPEL